MPTKTFISADTSSQQSHNSSCCIPVWFTLLVIIATVANIAATWLIAQESTTVNRENTTRMVQAIDKANEMGLLQFGNAENLELYKKVQALKAPEINKQIQAELSKAQAGTAAQAPAVIDNAAPQAMKKLTDEQVKSLLANNYIEGQAVAKITIAEFSDFECPYCIRHFSDGVVKALLKKYSTSVNFTFHPIVLANHPNWIPKGFALLCVGKYAGTEAYNTFMKSVFTESVSGLVGLDRLPALAAATKVDAAKFKKCYDSQETKGAFDAVRALSDSLGVNGTPSTIIINNATKEYMVVSGAAPTADFEKAIDAMLK